jgi:hypothetical protein
MNLSISNSRTSQPGSRVVTRWSSRKRPGEKRRGLDWTGGVWNVWIGSMLWCSLLCLAGCRSEADEYLEEQKELPTHSFKKFVRPPRPQPDPTISADLAEPPAEPPRTNAKETVDFLLEGIRKRQPERFVLFLPKSWRNDLNEAMHEAAWSMDSMIWSRSFYVLGRFGLAMKAKFPLMKGLLNKSAIDIERQKTEKTDEIVSGNLPSRSASDGKSTPLMIEQNFQELIEVINLLAFSRVTELDQLRRGTVEEILRESGRRVMGRMAYEAELRGETPFELLCRLETSTEPSQQEGVSIVVLKDPLTGQSQRIEFVQVEDAFVPRSMAQAWPDFLEETREWGRQFSRIDWEELRPDVMANLAAIEAQILRIDAATDASGMLPALSSIGEELARIAERLSPESARSLPQVGPPQKVTILINRPLGGEQLTQVLDQMVSICPKPNETEYVTSTLGGQTIVEIGPVNDLADFAEKLGKLRTSATGIPADAQPKTEVNAATRKIVWSLP